MQRFDKLKVGTKLLAGFLTVSLITALVGVVSITDMGTMEELEDRLYGQELLGLSYTQEAHVDLVAYDLAMGKMLIATTAEDRERASEEMAQSKALFVENLDSARTVTHTERGKALIAVVQEAWREYDAASASVVEISRRGGLQARSSPTALVDAARRKADAVGGAMGRLSRLRRDQARAAAAEATRIYDRSRLHMILLVVGSIVACAGIGFFMARRLAVALKQVADRAEQLRTRAIARVAAASEALARGDFTATVVVDVESLDLESRDEVGDLARSLDGMTAETRTAAAAFHRALAALREVIDQTDVVVQAAQDGQLGERADASSFAGGYRQLVEGLNQVLEAVVTPISEAQSVLERVAARDLTARVVGEYNGDHASLVAAVNTSLTNLEELLSEVAGASDKVTAASGRISSGGQSLAEGTSEQASSLGEVSASLPQLASTTRQNASNAQEARALADGARASAGQGVEHMQRLSYAIEKIRQCSDTTAKIVKTIDEIAFQANLLALNAAVEAARAGDAGKGFAVVAVEVRNLAMRSAEAARNAATLIEEVLRSADGGVSINNEVLAHLGEINDQLVKAGAVMTDVAVASNLQSQGIDRITAAVDRMNGVTQEAAASSEGSAATAEELKIQADRMRSLVEQFVLSTNSPQPGSAPRGAVRAETAQGGTKGGDGDGNGKKGNGKTSRGKDVDMRQLVPAVTAPLPEEASLFTDGDDQRTLRQF